MGLIASGVAERLDTLLAHLMLLRGPVDHGQSACFENRAWAGACRWEGNIVALQSSPAACAEILVISTRELHGKPAIAQLVEHLTVDTLQ